MEPTRILAVLCFFGVLLSSYCDARRYGNGYRDGYDNGNYRRGYRYNRGYRFNNGFALGAALNAGFSGDDDDEGGVLVTVVDTVAPVVDTVDPIQLYAISALVTAQQCAWMFRFNYPQYLVYCV
jgi:hypothetical protein